MRTNIEAELRQISSKHTNLFWPGRDKYTGWVMPQALSLGNSFQMSSREGGLVWTTPILWIGPDEKRDGWTVTHFKTGNSHYELLTRDAA